MHSTALSPARAELAESFLGSLALWGDLWEGQVLLSGPAEWRVCWCWTFLLGFLSFRSRSTFEPQFPQCVSHIDLLRLPWGESLSFFLSRSCEFLISATLARGGFVFLFYFIFIFKPRTGASLSESSVGVGSLPSAGLEFGQEPWLISVENGVI